MNTLFTNQQVDFKGSKEREIESKNIIIKNRTNHCKAKILIS